MHVIEITLLLQTDVPDSDKIPQSDAIGVTLILLSGYYREREFVRVGYYVNNDYDPICNINPDDRPKKPDFSKILRFFTLKTFVTIPKRHYDCFSKSNPISNRLGSRNWKSGSYFSSSLLKYLKGYSVLWF